MNTLQGAPQQSLDQAGSSRDSTLRVPGARPDDGLVDVEGLWGALHDVTDPEIPISIVDMGLIVDIAAHGGDVTVKITFTAMGCPAMDMIMDDVRERLLREPGVGSVHLEVVWDPIWTSERLTADGKQTLLEYGIAV